MNIQFSSFSAFVQWAPIRLRHFIVFSSVIFCLLTSAALHAQEGAADTAESSKNNIYSNSYEAGLLNDDLGEIILRYEVFAPKFPELEETFRDADKRYFEQILKTLDQVKAELSSTYITLADKKQRLDSLAILRGRYFYRADTLLTTNYYEATLPTIRANYYLVKSLGFLSQLEELLARRVAAFRAELDNAQVQKVTYELKTLLGVVHTLSGSTNNLFQAAAHFEYVLGQNDENIVFISEQKERQLAYYYLAGIYDRLYHKVKYDDDILSRTLIRKKLFYLWNLVELNHDDNKDLKDIKLSDLAERYIKIMDVKGINFKNLYAPYVDKLVGQFQTVEETVELAPVNQLSGARAQEEDSEANSAPPQ